MLKKIASLLLSFTILCTTVNIFTFAKAPASPTPIPSSMNFDIPAPNEKMEVGRKKYIETFDDKIIFHNIHPKTKDLIFARDFNNTFVKYLPKKDDATSDFFQQETRREGIKKAVDDIFETWKLNGVPMNVIANEQFSNWLIREFTYYCKDKNLVKYAIYDSAFESLTETLQKTISRATAGINDYLPIAVKGAGILSATYVASKLVGLFGDVNNFRHRFWTWLKSMLSVSRHRIEDNPEKIAQGISEEAKKKLVGQDEVIDKVANKLAGHFEKVKRNKQMNVIENSPCIMCFAGDSGNGKSELAKIIAETIGKKPIYINPQMLKIDNSAEGKSPIEQLFGTVTTVDAKGKKMEVPTELAAQIKSNNEVVIVFEEWDKMSRFDLTGSIDEFLRQINDRGFARVGKDTLHFSPKSVIILTTNESKESLEKGSALGRTDNYINVQDTTGARTVVGHDPSFLFRLTKIYFKALDASDLLKIAEPKIDELKKYYKKQYKINVEVPDKIVREMADSAAKKKKGARGINEYTEQIDAAAVDFRVWCQNNKAKYKNRTISVTFDKDRDEVRYQQERF